MQAADTIFSFVYGFFNSLIAQPLQQAGIPLGPGDWFLIIYTLIFVVIIIAIFRRKGSSKLPEGVTKIIASVGDVSEGLAGAKQLKFIKTPNDALVFLKIEENAIQQAMAAIEYYASKGEIDEAMKDKLMKVYQDRIELVRTAIAKDTQLKEIVDADTAVDRARSDYLRKLAAMSGTEVESSEEDTGPSSVGMPGTVSSGAPATETAAATPSGGPPGGDAPSGGPPGGGTPSGGPPGGSAPSGGPPGGGTPSGGPPGGDAPSGGPPGGGTPSGGPPGGGTPSGGPPGGDAPSGGPPGGGTPSGGPPGGGTPGGTPGGSTPSGGTPGGSTPGGKPSGGKSTLQSEMLREMERLKALMGGD